MKWLNDGVMVFLQWIVYYLLFAGGTWLVLYKIIAGRIQHKKISSRVTQKTQITREISYSVLTLFIYAAAFPLILFTGMGNYAMLYFDISQHGWTYFFFSVVVLVLYHDTYFYWYHRLLHWKKIFPYVHRIHHLSRDPSPWAAFSFHPIEGLLSVFTVPVVVFFMPLHPLAIFIFLLYMLATSVLGHCGHELYPRSFVKGKYTKWINTSLHHAMHHGNVNYNYGLYFSFWDRMMNTNHPDYERCFEDISSKTLSSKIAEPQLHE